jgi:hypothetical protein
MNEIKVILQTIAEYDLFSEVIWDAECRFYILCNDLFYWASSDAEPLDDLPLLKQSMTDMGDEFGGHLLYCCRHRKMRPQPAFYKENKFINKELFDACGPERQQHECG